MAAHPRALPFAGRGNSAKGLRSFTACGQSTNGNAASEGRHLHIVNSVDVESGFSASAALSSAQARRSKPRTAFADIPIPLIYLHMQLPPDSTVTLG